MTLLITSAINRILVCFAYVCPCFHALVLKAIVDYGLELDLSKEGVKPALVEISVKMYAYLQGIQWMHWFHGKPCTRLARFEPGMTVWKPVVKISYHG